VNVAELDRRRFIVSAAAVAGGMALSLKPERAHAVGAPAAAELNPWIVVQPDDAVVVRAPTPEIGNGALTQVAMNVTEELACDWSKVRVEFASIQRDYLEKGVYSAGWLPFFSGHGTDPDRMKRALQLGASARERLKAAAAARWKVPVAEVEAGNSVLTHKPTGRTLRYGEVATEAAAVRLAASP
jgi:isoquinoline 1-oxidoreductase beta subunit